MILILGMPRSGTSLTAKIIEKLGFNFNINPFNTLDEMFLPNTQYYQHKSLFLELCSTQSMNFEKINMNIELPECDVIKEPYLLFTLDSIRSKISKIILVVRNPVETIESCRTFKSLNYNTDNNVQMDKWNKYYITFLEEVKDIPYLIVNYNNYQNNFLYEVNKIKTFLTITKEPNLADINFHNNNNYNLLNIPPITKYIYLNLISENKSNYTKILQEYLKYNKLKPNDLCFCNSKKKFKKCCKNF